jgi:hypothetical protein
MIPDENGRNVQVEPFQHRGHYEGLFIVTGNHFSQFVSGAGPLYPFPAKAKPAAAPVAKPVVAGVTSGSGQQNDTKRFSGKIENLVGALDRKLVEGVAAIAGAADKGVKQEKRLTDEDKDAMLAYFTLRLNNFSAALPKHLEMFGRVLELLGQAQPHADALDKAVKARKEFIKQSDKNRD